MRQRKRLLAVPYESLHSDMSVIVGTHPGAIMRGAGRDDYLCGRCGRLLLHAVDRHSVMNLWFKCPKCGWLNGMDVDLGWAEYVVEQLSGLELSSKRIELLLDELKTLTEPVERFVERNPDVGPVSSWLSKIGGIAAVVAILSLVYTIYSTQQAIHVAEEQLDVAREQAKPRSLTPDEVRRIATELHRLQQALAIKPPPRSPHRRVGPRRK